MKKLLLMMSFLCLMELDGLAYQVSQPTKTPQEAVEILTDLNQLIVLGTLKGVEESYYYKSEQFPNSQIIATDFVIQIQDVLKGKLDSSTILLQVPGGCIPQDDLCFQTDVAPTLHAGEKLLLFLNPTSDGKWFIWDFIMGKETLSDGLYQPLNLSLTEIKKIIQETKP